MIRNSVVFPDPDGEEQGDQRPDGASTVTPWSTTLPSNDLTMFLAVMLMLL